MNIGICCPRATALRTAVGAAVPTVCAVHCLAAPILVALAAAVAENARLEFALMGASLLVGGSAVRSGVLVHGERRLWIVLALSVLLFAFGRTPLAGSLEPAATALGNFAVLCAIVGNARLRRRCACGGCACDLEVGAGSSA